MRKLEESGDSFQRPVVSVFYGENLDTTGLMHGRLSIGTMGKLLLETTSPRS